MVWDYLDALLKKKGHQVWNKARCTDLNLSIREEEHTWSKFKSELPGGQERRGEAIG